MAEALQSQTGAAFSKYLGAYQDAAATGANDRRCRGHGPWARSSSQWRGVP